MVAIGIAFATGPTAFAQARSTEIASSTEKARSSRQLAAARATTLVQVKAKLTTLRGKHIVLKADGGSRDSLQDLVDAFDAAVPQWERFWELPPGALSDWVIDAFVMDDPQVFRASGDLPETLRFPFGYAISGNVWVMRQSSDYYTRHLLLHEGMHALSIDRFGGTGPSWFAEGFAELLSVHGGSGSDVRVNVVPHSRAVVPYWGRFKLLSARREENRIPTFDEVMRFPNDLKSDVESYGWVWAAAMLLTEYPEYRREIIAAAKNGDIRLASFSDQLKRKLNSQWPIVSARWRMLVSTVDYGFDWRFERIELSMKDPLWNGKTFTTEVDAKQGWQSPGVRFAPGTRLTISARGRCSLNPDPKPWVSEPAGVTIHYSDGKPLGQLQVCVLPNRTEEQRHLKPLRVESVDSQFEITIDEHCWLLFRINDYLGDRANNEGGYRLVIRRQ